MKLLFQITFSTLNYFLVKMNVFQGCKNEYAFGESFVWEIVKEYFNEYSRAAHNAWNIREISKN